MNLLCNKNKKELFYVTKMKVRNDIWQAKDCEDTLRLLL